MNNHKLGSIIFSVGLLFFGQVSLADSTVTIYESGLSRYRFHDTNLTGKILSTFTSCDEDRFELGAVCAQACGTEENSFICGKSCVDSWTNFCANRQKVTIPSLSQVTALSQDNEANKVSISFLGSEQKKLSQQIQAFNDSINTIPEKLLKIQASKDFKAAVKKQVECEIKNIKADLRAEILVELGKPVPSPKPKVNCDNL